MKSSQTLKERKEMMTALALIAPTIIVMVIFLYIPFVNALQTSFYKYNGLGDLEHFVGLKNYAKVLADPKFVRSLWNTFYLIMVSFLAIPIGFVFAYILYVGVPGKKIFNAGLFIPYLISMVVVGCIWRIIFSGSNLSHYHVGSAGEHIVFFTAAQNAKRSGSGKVQLGKQDAGESHNPFGGFGAAAGKLSQRRVGMGNKGSHAGHIAANLLKQEKVVGQGFRCLTGQADHKSAAGFITQTL